MEVNERSRLEALDALTGVKYRRKVQHVMHEKDSASSTDSVSFSESESVTDDELSDLTEEDTDELHSHSHRGSTLQHSSSVAASQQLGSLGMSTARSFGGSSLPASVMDAQASAALGLGTNRSDRGSLAAPLASASMNDSIAASQQPPRRRKQKRFRMGKVRISPLLFRLRSLSFSLHALEYSLTRCAFLPYRYSLWQIPSAAAAGALARTMAATAELVHLGVAAQQVFLAEAKFLDAELRGISQNGQTARSSSVASMSLASMESGSVGSAGEEKEQHEEVQARWEMGMAVKPTQQSLYQSTWDYTANSLLPGTDVRPGRGLGSKSPRPPSPGATRGTYGSLNLDVPLHSSLVGTKVRARHPLSARRNDANILGGGGGGGSDGDADSVATDKASVVPTVPQLLKQSDRLVLHETAGKLMWKKKARRRRRRHQRTGIKGKRYLERSRGKGKTIRVAGGGLRPVDVPVSATARSAGKSGMERALVGQGTMSKEQVAALASQGMIREAGAFAVIEGDEDRLIRNTNFVDPTWEEPKLDEYGNKRGRFNEKGQFEPGYYDAKGQWVSLKDDFPHRMALSIDEQNTLLEPLGYRTSSTDEEPSDLDEKRRKKAATMTSNSNNNSTWADDTGTFGDSFPSATLSSQTGPSQAATSMTGTHLEQSQASTAKTGGGQRKKHKPKKKVDEMTRMEKLQRARKRAENSKGRVGPGFNQDDDEDAGYSTGNSDTMMGEPPIRMKLLQAEAESRGTRANEVRAPATGLYVGSLSWCCTFHCLPPHRPLNA